MRTASARPASRCCAPSWRSRSRRARSRSPASTTRARDARMSARRARDSASSRSLSSARPAPVTIAAIRSASCSMPARCPITATTSPSRTSGVTWRPGPSRGGAGAPPASTRRPSPAGYARARAGSPSIERSRSWSRPASVPRARSSTMAASAFLVRRPRTTRVAEPAARTIRAIASTDHSARSTSSMPIEPRGTLRAASNPKATSATAPGSTTGAIRRRAAVDARATRTAATTATSAAHDAATTRPPVAASRPTAGASATARRFVGHAGQSATDARVMAGTSPSRTTHAT